MDWDLAIDRNRALLLKLLAMLIASVERVSGGSMGQLPRFMRTNVWRSLRPATSAVRRLVFVTAHLLAHAGFSVKPRNGAARAFPQAGIARGEGKALPAFPLFDPQKDFGDHRRKFAKNTPRIWLFDGSDPVFEPYAKAPVPLADDPVEAAVLLGRLRALKLALEDLPKQAKRLLRTQARRAQKPPGPGRIGPLRAGFPPGHAMRPVRQVDDVLQQCSWLARRVVDAPDTS